MTLGGGFGEMLEQQQDVLVALAQRRNSQRRDVEPVVQVGAEPALIRGYPQVLLGRGDDPDIQGDRLVAAEPFDHPLLQQAQQLDLHIQAHALDLVEEQRAAVGEFELADAPLLRAGEGARLVAEQFAFHHRFGERPGVDRDEGAVAPAGQVVQRPGNHLLAGARFAENQYIGLGPGQRADLFAQTQHRLGLSEQARRQLLPVGQGQAQGAVVQHQLAQRQGTTHAVQQRFAGEGFFQEIVSAGAHRLHRQLNITVPGDEDHRHLAVARAQLLQQLEAIDAGHANVADHHAWPVRWQPRGQVAGIAQADDLETGQVEGLAQCLTQVRIVVDQQHLRLGADRLVTAH